MTLCSSPSAFLTPLAGRPAIPSVVQCETVGFPKEIRDLRKEGL